MRLAELGQRFTVVRPASIDNVLQVISGELDAVVDSRGATWDHAPAVILVTEAGGRFTDPEGGRRIDLGLGRYSNGLIDAELDALLG